MMRDILSNSTHSIRPARKARLPLTVLAPWALAGAVLIATGVLAFFPREVEGTPPPPGHSGALVWGDGVFANALELEAWLRIRGVSYKTWARRHPAAVKIIAPRPVPVSGQTSK